MLTIYNRSNALAKISTELFYINRIEDSVKRMEDSIALASIIEDEIDKDESLHEIAIELSKMNLVKESLDILQMVNVEWVRNSALFNIAIQLAKNRCWENIEKVTLEITDTQYRTDCFLKVGKIIADLEGLENCLLTIYEYFSKENSGFILNGVCGIFTQINCTKDMTFSVLKHSNIFLNTVQNVLEFYTLNQLFIQTLNENKFERLNQTLNLQWALDLQKKAIKN
jgi:hypothetical protein